MGEIVAGTGHRPDKLGGYNNDAADNCLRLIAHKYLAALRPSAVISGMALGWDQRLAEAALLAGIPLIAAVPFDGQDGKWPPRSRAIYAELLRAARHVHVVSPGPYASWKMHKRNQWMVDFCTRVVAMYNGDPQGGTAACVSYAEQRRRPIDNLWTEWALVEKAA